jgi:hypothetical protein
MCVCPGVVRVCGREARALTLTLTLTLSASLATPLLRGKREATLEGRTHARCSRTERKPQRGASETGAAQKLAEALGAATMVGVLMVCVCVSCVAVWPHTLILIHSP